MASQEDWQRVGEQLGAVLVQILDEFEDMCRGSDHEQAALEALARLREMGGGE